MLEIVYGGGLRAECVQRHSKCGGDCKAECGRLVLKAVAGVKWGLLACWVSDCQSEPEGLTRLQLSLTGLVT